MALYAPYSYANSLRQNVGQGGGFLSNIWNAVTSVFKPQPKPVAKPAPARTTGLVPAGNVGIGRVSAPAPRPAPTPVQSKPSVLGTSNNRIPTPTPAKPTFTQTLQKTLGNGLSSISTAPSRIASAFSTPKSISNSANIKADTINATRPGLSTISRLGGALGTYGTALKLPELHISERLAALDPLAVHAAEPTMKPTQNYATPESSYTLGQITKNGLTFSDPNYGRNGLSSTDPNVMSMLGLNPSTTEKNINDTTQRYTEDTNRGNAAAQGMSDNAWAIYEEDYGNKEREITDRLERGEIDQEQANGLLADAQRQSIINAYERAKSDAEAQIPTTEAEYDKLVEDALQDLSRYKSSQGQLRATNEATFDERLRQNIKGRKANEGSLRNLFSNLGTAESSTFIDKMTDLATEGERADQGIQSEKARNLSNIDQALLNEETDTNRYVGDTRTKKQNAINEIRRYIQNLSGESADKVSEIMNSLLQANMNSRNALTDAKNTMTQKSIDRLANYQQGQQDYSFQKALLDQQYQNNKSLITDSLNGQDQIMGGKYIRPKGFSQNLWNLASKLYDSGVKGTALIRQLRNAGVPDAQEWMYNFLLNPS